MQASWYHLGMKYFFVEPICYGFFYAPVIGIPTLIGILEQHNHEAKYIGLNDDFIKCCLDEKFYTFYAAKKDKLCKTDLNDAPELILNLSKSAHDFFQKNTEKDFKYDSNKIKLANKILSNKEFFTNEFLYDFSHKTVMDLIEDISSIDHIFMHTLLPNIGTYRIDYQNQNFSIDINALKYYFNKKLSPIDDYLEKKADEIISENPDCVGISIGFPFYFITGMLLAYKIKQKSNIHVNVGGSFFNLYYQMIDNLPDLFGTFFDSISIENNTKTVTDILKYLNNEIKISEVSNILYNENGRILKSSSNDIVPIQNLPYQSFTGYNIYNTIIPKLVFPIQASNSCYWGKCKFCVCSGNSKFETNPVIKTYEELEYLSKKYNTKYFAFWDNSMHPEFLSKLADLILERKLKIKFSVYARFEKEFKYKLLKKLKKAGCIKIHWGLDSANQRILDYVNKGIEIETSERVLKDAKKAGIYNFVYIILGYPTETKEEMDCLYTYLKKNSKNINNIYIQSEMLFTTNSIFSQNKNEFKAKVLTTLDERKNYKKYIKRNFPLISSRDFSSIQTTPLMLLYVEKYGNGFREILNKKFMSFMKSHPKILLYYLRHKSKQVIKNK